MDKNSAKQFIREILKIGPKNIESLEHFKRSFLREKNGDFIRNTDTREVYNEMIKSKEIQPNKELEELLLTKRIRTLSGVAVVAVLTKPYNCPGKCLYCPTEKKMPKSYLSNEPAVMRAILTSFHPYRQVQVRLRSLQINGHATDKIELIAMGGTFSYFPLRYQKWFIKECFRAANDFPKKIGSRLVGNSNLEREKKRNEKAKNRIVGLTLETRPDFIDENEIKKFRYLGATRVELGVQTVFDDILAINKRGHLVDATIKATKLLKDAGFKINYHLMPGLLGSSLKKDLELFKIVYSDSRFQPDMVKIYPCVVTKNSRLYKLWKEGKYKPLNNRQTKELMIKIKAITPPYVRISRLIRDIPAESIMAGPNISNLRQVLQNKGVKCSCIRCREIREKYSLDDDIILNRIDYMASGGKEVFLQFTSKDKKKLYAILRLRIPNKIESEKHFLNALKNCALIREVHTYGKLVRIKDKTLKSPQHIGLGRRLMRKAEEITKEEGFKKIAVISGVGVRGYYRKNGYRLQDEYMVLGHWY